MNANFFVVVLFLLHNCNNKINVLCLLTQAFFLFLGMVVYANEVETKEKEKLPEIKN